MAGIKDIMEIERDRHSPGEYGKIYIFQEGSFYRAYQFSTWLCTMLMVCRWLLLMCSEAKRLLLTTFYSMPMRHLSAIYLHYSRKGTTFALCLEDVIGK